MNIPDLNLWTPLRLCTHEQQTDVDWTFVGDERFTDSFYEQTISRCLRHPANLLFRHETAMDELGAMLAGRDCMEPKGFIFHMSRCGSTLIAQMLAAVHRCRVISEARPINDALMRAPDDAHRVDWVRSIVRALGLRRGAEEFMVVKFDAWHVLQLPLIARAFPRTPWIFVYRNPLEVLVSQTRQRGVQVIPGALDPCGLGLPPDVAWFTRMDEYAARVLGAFCEAAANACGANGGRLVAYEDLPNAATSDVVKWFGLPLTDGERENMQAAAGFDAKRPALTYAADSDEKRAEATSELRDLAQQFIQPAYERLERLRAAQPRL